MGPEGISPLKRSLLQRLSEPRLVQRLTVRLLVESTSAALRAVAAPLYWWRGRASSLQRRNLADYKRILVVRTDEIGDVVLNSAFLRELRANAPDAWITLVVTTATLGLVRSCPYVNEVLAHEWKNSKYLGPVRCLFAAVRLATTKLWGRRFDLAIVPRWNTDYYGASQLVYLSGAPRRVAYSEKVSPTKRRLNAGHDRLFTDLLTDDTPKHEVERDLDVLRYLGGTIRNDALEVWTTPDDVSSAQAMLAAEGVAGDELVIALGVGSRGAQKVWPAGNFIDLARLLHEERKARLLVVGGKADIETGQLLSAALGPAVVNFAGRTSLGQLTEILRRADLFVGNDSGPKHVAAAAGVPVVEVSWHPRSGDPANEYAPLAFGPWGTPSQILQPADPLPPCTDTCHARVAHCITQVGVEQVKEAAEAFLDLRVKNR